MNHTVKISIYLRISCGEFSIFLMEPIPYNRHVGLRFIIPSTYGYKVQTYTGLVPLKCEIIATRYPWIYGYFYSAQVEDTVGLLRRERLYANS